MRPSALLLLALLAPAPLLAQTVAAERGNVVLRTAAGEARRLTDSGLDAAPRLSPDGAWVAFVRATPGDSVDAGTGRVEARALWLVRADGGGARALVRARASDAPERILAALQGPRWSADGREVFFLSAAWATSGAVHAVDVASGAVRFVAPGNSLEVVPSGRYAGHLLVEQHRHLLAGGTYDWTWLLTPAGEEVGPVGEGPAAVEAFHALHAGGGHADDPRW